MICERHGFIQGFLAAASLYGDDRLSQPGPEARWRKNEAGRRKPAMEGRTTRLAYEKYLDIPTFIRQGKRIRGE